MIFKTLFFSLSGVIFHLVQNFVSTNFGSDFRMKEENEVDENFDTIEGRRFLPCSAGAVIVHTL